MPNRWAALSAFFAHQSELHAMTDDFDIDRFQTRVMITLLTILHAALPGKGELWMRLFETRQALLQLERELPAHRRRLEQLDTPTDAPEWNQLQRQEQLVAREVPNLTQALIQQRADWLGDLHALAPADPAWSCAPIPQSPGRNVDRAEWARLREQWEAVSLQKAETIVQHPTVQTSLCSIPASATNDPRQIAAKVTQEVLRLASARKLDIPRIPVLFAALAIVIVQQRKRDTQARPS
jgi:hypothetical protein